MKRSLGYFVGLLVTCALAVPMKGARAADHGPNHDAEQRDAIQSILKDSKISLTKAIEVAQKQAGTGQVLESGAHREKGKPVFVVVISGSGGVREYYVDAATGEFLRFATQSESPNSDFSDVKVTPAQAIETAMKKIPNSSAFGADLARGKDRPLFTVYLLAGDELKRVEIDAVTKEIGKVENGGYREETRMHREGNFDESNGNGAEPKAK